MIIWIILIVAITVCSFIFAYLSVRSYRQFPAAKLPYGVFLIRNYREFSAEMIHQLHSYVMSKSVVVSLEKVNKEHQSVMMLYAPLEIQTALPKFELLEVEDYLQSVGEDKTVQINRPNALRASIDDCLVWLIEPRTNDRKPLNVQPHFLKMLSLTQGQSFFWQLVLGPLSTHQFQTTVRAMVVDKNPVSRVDLAKRINHDITEATGLIRTETKETQAYLFESFRKRVLIPKEIKKFLVNPLEVEQLLGVN